MAALAGATANPPGQYADSSFARCGQAMPTILPNSENEFSRHEPIPGYVTQELIGRGGYGEVWRAIAPGGLAKAIKIVYGDGDSNHAIHEMRAVGRVKDVRHPLLLSIERVESICGNLVIVTELGDGNLKDCFRSYREKQLPGIPQTQLFGIGRDIADALDYMYSEYSLQHLDVKPENILMVGGRAKLGDYGLVKNLYERSCSLVNGLTPTYSPPELFEGRPSRNSDQYSFAILYMQMLTGELPFLAATTAQIATQHLQAAPDLSSLPKHQRPIIARALSKDPEQRYESCRAVVDALEAVEAAETPKHETAGQPGPNDAATPRDTAGQSFGQSLPQQPAATPMRQVAGQASRVETDDVDPSASRGRADAEALCPTVVVGVGSTGGAVLERFLTRIRDRVGPLADSSWLQGLVIDTDGKQLNALVESNPLMQDVRTVPILLQKAESYTRQSASVLRWLDRRWFYNIPRDLSTSGLRPLGRLAFVTNPSRIKDAIASAISLATSAQPPSDSIQRLGLPYQPVGCRVIIVGSIAGGTGGGTMLDLAYAVRTELKRRQLCDEDVQGVLLHSTPRGNKERDRAIANTYATLRELNHFSRPGNFYPGEPALDVPPYHGDNSPFSTTYFATLGENLGPAEWRTATERVAEWLFCSNVTPARQLLTAAGPDNERSPEQVLLHSFDVVELGAGGGETIAHVARQAAADVIKLWRDGRNAQWDHNQGTLSAPTKLLDTISQIPLSNTRSEQEDATISGQLESFGLVMDELVGRACEVAQLELGMSENTKENAIERIVEETLGGVSDDSDVDRERVNAAIKTLDRLLHGGSRDNELDQDTFESLYDRLIARLAVRDNQGTAKLLEWLRNLVDVPAERVDGVRYTANVVRRLIQELQDDVNLQAGCHREKSLETAVTMREVDAVAYEKATPKRWLARRRSLRDMLKLLLVQYVEQCIEEVVLNAVLKQLRVIDAEVTSIIERANEMSRQLGQLSDRLGQSFDVTLDHDSSVPSSVFKYQRFLLESLLAKRSDLARAVEVDIDQNVLSGGRGLQRFMAGATDISHSLIEPLKQASRMAVLRCIAELNKQLIEGTSSPDIGRQVDLAEILKQIVAGDEKQRVVIVPDEVDCGSLQQELRTALGSAAICSGRTSEITVCSGHNLPSLQTVADEVAHGIDMFKELSSRLLTRVDVRWDAITDVAPPQTPPPAADAGEPATFTQTAPVASLQQS